MNFPCDRCQTPVVYRRFKAVRPVWGYLDVRGMRFLTSPPHPQGVYLCMPCVRQAVAQRETIHVVVTSDVLAWGARRLGLKVRVLRDAIGRKVKEKRREEKRRSGDHKRWSREAEIEFLRQNPWLMGVATNHIMIGLVGLWLKQRSA